MKRLAFVALLLPATAAAQSMQVTSTTELAWHGDNDNEERFDDDYASGVQRLFASATSGKWVLGVDFQLSGFASTPVNDGTTSALENRYENELGVERAWVGWQGRDLEMTAGDSYVAFGRGLGLTLRKVDALGVDTSLRGARVVWRKSVVEATAVAGYTNIANLDSASGRHTEDPEDLIGGGQLSLKITDGINIGGHAETIAFRRPLSFVPAGMEPPDYVDRWVLAGPVIDAPRITKWLGFYAEGIVQDRSDKRGYGAYGALTFTKSALTVLLEGKAYGDLEVVQPRFEDSAAEFTTVRYTTPPTAERLLQPLEHAQQRIGGGRVRSDYKITERLIATAAYALFRDHVGYLTTIDPMMAPELRPGTIHDPWAGLELKWDDGSSHAQLSGGARFVIADDTRERVRTDKHVEYDITEAWGKRWQFQLHGTHMQRAKVEPPFVDERFIEGSAQLGAIWNSKLSLSGSWDYTTDILAPRTHYPSAAVGWRPTTRASVDLQAGRMRGGLKCLSGVCREFPPFEGARLSITLRY